jgi:hypothetical protein
MKLEFSWYIFEKYSSIKFHENPSSGGHGVPRGGTDGHHEANSRFLQLCERSQKTHQKRIKPTKKESSGIIIWL